MQKTQLLAAISILGVSLGMTTAAQAAACANGEHCDATNPNQSTNGVKMQPDVFELKTNTSTVKQPTAQGGTMTEKVTLHHEGLYEGTNTDYSTVKDSTKSGPQNGNAGTANSKNIELHSWSWGSANPGVANSPGQGGGNAANAGTSVKPVGGPANKASNGTVQTTGANQSPTKPQ